MTMTNLISKRRRVLVGAAGGIACVLAALVLWPDDSSLCDGENSGTLTKEKLQTGDLVLVHQGFTWFSPHLSPIYVFNMKAQVVSRIGLELEQTGAPVDRYVLEQRELSPDETRVLRDLLVAQGLDRWPEYVNPKEIVDGFQWHFETWEGNERLQLTTFDNVEPRCARTVLGAMSDLLAVSSARIEFDTGGFAYVNGQSIVELLRLADSLLTIDPEPSLIGAMRFESGSECRVTFQAISSSNDQVVGGLLRIDEPSSIVVNGHERNLPHGDLFGVVVEDAGVAILRFVIDGTINDGIEILVRESENDGFMIGEVRHLSYIGDSLIGEMSLEPAD